MQRNVTCRVNFSEKSFAQIYKLARVRYSVLLGTLVCIGNTTALFERGDKVKRAVIGS
jgi:hypothetical protein